jgi:hypothetical protein
MTSKLLPFGAVLLAQSLAEAQSVPAPAASTAEPSSYNFDGRLEYRAGDGTLVPLLPDAIFVGWGDDGCQITRQSSERLAFYPDGSFRVSVSTKEFFISYPMGGSPPEGSVNKAARREPVLWPCYRFRADGCDDAIVKFGPTPPGASIELSCPGRRSGGP